MSHNPYIVIGTGRSGSSTVARVLHNKMDVFMGYEFRKTDENNSSGYWEDVEFAGPNWRLLNGKITYPKWIKDIFAVIDRRVNLNVPWGFKDPDATHFLGLYLSFFEAPRIVRCSRDKELVVSSLMRCFGYTEEHASTVHRRKEWILDNLLSERNHLVIHFGEQWVDDESIIRVIQEKIW